MATRMFVALAVAAVSATVPAYAQDVTGPRLQIVEGRGGVDPVTGFVHIRGEVWNRTAGWVKSPRVMVELFDASGKAIDVSGFLAETKKELHQDERDSVVTERYYLPPGQMAAFEYVRDPQKLGGKTYGSHKLSAAAWNLPEGGPTAAVEGMQSAKDTDGSWKVTGSIKNTGKAPCRSPKAVLAFYGADNKVVHVTSEEPSETFQKMLAPGQAVSFARHAIDAGAAAATVKSWGDCSDPD